MALRRAPVSLALSSHLRAALLGLVHVADAVAGDTLVPALGTVLEAAWIGAAGTPVGARSVGSACVPLLARCPAGRARLEAVQARLGEPALREEIESALAPRR